MPPPVPERVVDPRFREEHRATHEDANARAWLNYCRTVFPQSVRKAGSHVDLHNVSTYHCSILFNNKVSFNRKSEFRKTENMDKPFSPQEKFNVTDDRKMSLLIEFCGINNAHVILTAKADNIGCHSSRRNDLSVHARIDFQGMFAFWQSLRSSLAKGRRRQVHNCHSRVSERLSSSLTTWSLLDLLWKAMMTPLSLQQDAMKSPASRRCFNKCVTLRLMSLRAVPTPQHTKTTKIRSTKICTILQLLSCSEKCSARSIRDIHLKTGFTLMILPIIILILIVALLLFSHGESRSGPES